MPVRQKSHCLNLANLNSRHRQCATLCKCPFFPFFYKFQNVDLTCPSGLVFGRLCLLGLGGLLGGRLGGLGLLGDLLLGGCGLLGLGGGLGLLDLLGLGFLTALGFWPSLKGAAAAVPLACLRAPALTPAFRAVLTRALILAASAPTL